MERRLAISASALIAAISFASALWLLRYPLGEEFTVVHLGQSGCHSSIDCPTSRRHDYASWQGPLAVFIAVMGLGAAAAVGVPLRNRRRRLVIVSSALIAAISVVSALWLYGALLAKSVTVVGPVGGRGSCYANTDCVTDTRFGQASWQDPLAVFIAVAGLGVAGLGVAAAVVVPPRHRNA